MAKKQQYKIEYRDVQHYSYNDVEIKFYRSPLVESYEIVVDVVYKDVVFHCHQIELSRNYPNCVSGIIMRDISFMVGIGVFNLLDGYDMYQHFIKWIEGKRL